MKYIDLTGQRFGKWTAIADDGRKSGQTMWLCVCECGKRRSVSAGSLRSGISKSCGCAPNKAPSDERVFFSKIFPVTESGCWLWTGAVDFSGYGTAFYKRKQTRAHRASYEIHFGPIPNGLTIDHLCRVKCCVNPAHLEAVTLRENNLRGWKFRRQRKWACQKTSVCNGMD